MLGSEAQSHGPFGKIFGGGGKAGYGDSPDIVGAMPGGSEQPLAPEGGREQAKVFECNVTKDEGGPCSVRHSDFSRREAAGQSRGLWIGGSDDGSAVHCIGS